ncbi:UNVERIFIED_CONTAM: hypothetical protein FKN15_076314 [Acipenser sinensis]
MVAISWYAFNITREFFDPLYPGTKRLTRSGAKEKGAALSSDIPVVATRTTRISVLHCRLPQPAICYTRGCPRFSPLLLLMLCFFLSFLFWGSPSLQLSTSASAPGERMPLTETPETLQQALTYGQVTSHLSTSTSPPPPNTAGQARQRLRPKATMTSARPILPALTKMMIFVPTQQLPDPLP